MNIMIKVFFFARLREQLGCDFVEIEHSGVDTVEDLRRRLGEKYPHWVGFLNDKKLLVAVNQTLVKVVHPVKKGDEVAFFPPVTGG